MSYLLIALPYLLQLLCIIHIVRTGRNTSWIWLIIFVPYVGGVAYLLVEVLPTLGRGGRRTLATTRDIVVRYPQPVGSPRGPRAHGRVLADPRERARARGRVRGLRGLREGPRDLRAARRGHARGDADLALAKARCLYALGQFEEGNRLLDELAARRARVPHRPGGPPAAEADGARRDATEPRSRPRGGGSSGRSRVSSSPGTTPTSSPARDGSPRPSRSSPGSRRRSASSTPWASRSTGYGCAGCCGCARRSGSSVSPRAGG